MQSNPNLVWIVLIGVIAIAGFSYLNSQSSHDLTQPPIGRSIAEPVSEMARLPSPPVLPPREPFASPWTEPSPADAVAADADRAVRQDQERQQEEERARPPGDKMMPQDGGSADR